MTAKTHLIPKGAALALCNSKIRSEGGRLAVATVTDFDLLDKDEQCAKCAAIVARITRHRK